MSASRLFIAAAVSACFILVSHDAVIAADLTKANWPQWRGPNRDGHAVGTKIRTDWDANPPELAWKVEGLGKGYAGIAVANGKAYTTGNFPNGQCLVAVDLQTQKVAWKTPISDAPPKHGYTGSRCTPTVVGKHIYVIVSNGAVACVEEGGDSGKIVWQRDFREDWNGRMMSGWGFSESPLIDGDRLICTPGGKNAMLVALNRETGEEIWKSAAPEGDRGKDGAGYASVVISEGAGVKQYVTLVGRGVIGVRAEDGKLLWSYGGVANKVANIPDPIAVGDYVFCSSGYGTGSALLKLRKDGDGVSATEEYFLRANTLQNHHGGLVRIGDYIYGGQGHNKGLPICVDLTSGEVAWGGKIRGVGSGSAAVVAVDGHLIFRYQSGELALIEATPKEYRLKGQFTPEIVSKENKWAHPSVTEGQMYLREQHALMVYNIGE